MTDVLRVHFLSGHSVCLYLVPFLRYAILNNGVILKFWLEITQGHRKYHHSVDPKRVPIGVS